MPVVSLRMSDGEHELLRGWAADSRRSMQREIIFRLFNGALTEREADTAGASEPVSAEGGVVDNRAASRSESAPDGLDKTGTPASELIAETHDEDGVQGAGTVGGKSAGDMRAAQNSPGADDTVSRIFAKRNP